MMAISGPPDPSTTSISIPFGASRSTGRLISLPRSVSFYCRLKPTTRLLTTFNRFSTCLRQLANDPIRFQRVFEPLFRPAFLDTACDGPLTDFLTQAIEKGEFPAWLIQAALKPFSLSFCRDPGTGVVFVRCSNLRLRFHGYARVLGNCARRNHGTLEYSHGQGIQTHPDQPLLRRRDYVSRDHLCHRRLAR